MSGGGKSANAGWRYFFGIHMGIGRGPVDALHAIRVGDREAWVGEVTDNTTINIDSYNLFGGEEKEGGIQGPLEIMMGGPAQTVSAGLQAMRPGPQPGYRGRFTAFFNGLIGMNNPYPKPWKFRLNRILKGWDGEVFHPTKARIGTVTRTGGETVRVMVPMKNDFTTDVVGSVNEALTTTTGGVFTGSGLRLDNGNSALVVLVYSDAIPSSVNRVRCSIEVFNISLDAVSPEDTVFSRGSPFRSGFLWDTPVLTGIQVDFRIFWDGLQLLGRFYIDNDLAYTLAEVPSELTLGCEYLKVGETPAVLNILIGGAVVGSVASPYQRPPDRFTFNNTSTGHHTVAPVVSTPTQLVYDIRNFLVSGEPVSPIVMSGFHSMNGAHIIYECLTNREWGRGLNRAKLDEASFTTAADTLFQEDFGLCLKWTREDSIENFVQMVIDHIGAALYTSRVTGLITLKLIRDDYDVESLPLYDDESGVLDVTEDTVGSVGRSVNTITVTWHDPIEDQDRTVTVKSPGAIVSSGGVVNSATKSYIGIPTANLALRVAQRDLRASSVALRRFTLQCDQRFDTYHAGDVFRFRDLKRGIPETVVRVGKVVDGTITDGRMTLSVAEDVFGTPAQAFAAEVPSTWTPPATRPCIDHQLVFEAPYFLMAQRMSASDLDYVNPDSGYLAAVNSRGRSTNAGVQLAVRDSAPTTDDEPTDSSYQCGI